MSLQIPPVEDLLDGVQAVSSDLVAVKRSAVSGQGMVSLDVGQFEHFESFAFVEAGDTTYTATVEIPAGAFLTHMSFVNTVLWDDGTSASLGIGDDDDADGWFTTVDLKATDLAVGEVIDITQAENWGGVQGAYLVAATGRKGRVTAGVDSGIYFGAASEIIAVVTTGGQDGTAGRSFFNVGYVVPTQQSPVAVA